MGLKRKAGRSRKKKKRRKTQLKEQGKKY